MNKKNFYNNITETIGNTPLVKLNSLTKKCQGNIFAKLESFNPAGSLKDRVGLNMINVAEQEGLINQNTVIVESTSGNTGIALALVCASKGYKLVITMPDSMSQERIKILKAFGAEVILTPGIEGMSGAMKKAEDIAKSIHNSFIPQQFSNPANMQIHKDTTAKEIWRDLAGDVDAVVAGVGTGGSLTGITAYLKEKKADIKFYAVEPLDSCVLSGGIACNHQIHGIGAGFIPKILNLDLIDEIVKVSNKSSFKYATKMAREEGILCGISSGAVIYAAIEIANRIQMKNKNIVVILPDSGERYLMTNLYELYQ